MKKDNKDDDDLDGFTFYLILIAGIVVLLALGKWLGVPELQGVFG